MAFTTGAHRHAPAQRSFHYPDEVLTTLKDRVDDLESAFLCNTSLLLDITSSKSASRDSSQQETETHVMFPASCFKKLKEQQRRIREAMVKFNCELSDTRERTRDFERRGEDVKSQESKHLRDLASQVKDLRKSAQQKEDTIQALERDYANLEIEASVAAKDREQGLNPFLSAQKLKKLIKEVKGEANRMEREKDALRSRCLVRDRQEQDAALNGDRSLFKSRNRRKELARIEESHFGLGLSYETYWYPRPGQYEERPVAEASDEEPAKIRPKSQQLVPKNLKDAQLEATLLEQASKMQELLLAFKMKQEELRSLARLSEQLQDFREHIVNSIEKIRVKRGEVGEYEEIEGFREEVQWDDSIFHDSPSDQR